MLKTTAANIQLPPPPPPPSTRQCSPYPTSTPAAPTLPALPHDPLSRPCHILSPLPGFLSPLSTFLSVSVSLLPWDASRAHGAINTCARVRFPRLQHHCPRVWLPLTHLSTSLSTLLPAGVSLYLDGMVEKLLRFASNGVLVCPSEVGKQNAMNVPQALTRNW